jgi:plastocyanin
MVRLAGLLLALGLLVGAAPAATAAHPALRPPAARALAVHVSIVDMAFSPSWVGIRRGRTVVWTNHDPMAHSVVVTSGPRLFRSPLLQPGDHFSHTFRVAGRYRYKCGVHPTMRGTIRVR